MEASSKLRITRIIYKGPEFAEDQIFQKIPVIDQHFDEKGQKIFECTYDAFGEPENILSWVYNENGQLIAYTETDPTQEFSLKEESFYAPDGRLTKKKIYYGDGSIDTEIFKYNSEKLLTEIVRVNDDNETEEVTLFIYHNGLKIREEVHIPGEGISSEKIFHYDEKNRLTEKIEWDAESRLKTVYAYNEEDFIFKTSVYDANGELIQDSEVLEMQGDLTTRMKEFSKNSPQRTIEFTYDENHRVVRETSYTEEGLLYSDIQKEYNAEGKLKIQKVITGEGYGTSPQYLVYIYEYESIDNHE